jgi:MFS family permease
VRPFGALVFGRLGDLVGRKYTFLITMSIMGGATFAVGLLPNYATAGVAAPVTVIADPHQCSFQFDPIGKNKFDSTSCDIAKSFLAKAGVSYQRIDAPPGTVAQIRSGTTTFTAPDPTTTTGKERKAAIAAFQAEVKTALSAAGYPDKANPETINKPMVVLILFILVVYVTMVYGPIAALLVELFPARIRYSAMSLPYHIGNGWFGGFLPTTARVRDGGCDRRYLPRALVSHRRGGCDVDPGSIFFCPKPSSAPSTASLVARENIMERHVL